MSKREHFFKFLDAIIAYCTDTLKAEKIELLPVASTRGRPDPLAFTLYLGKADEKALNTFWEESVCTFHGLIISPITDDSLARASECEKTMFKIRHSNACDLRDRTAVRQQLHLPALDERTKVGTKRCADAPKDSAELATPPLKRHHPDSASESSPPQLPSGPALS